ncbi:MAG: hypothetical protein NVS3B12_25000 [Acidimicrobiales bacterium]
MTAASAAGRPRRRSVLQPGGPSRRRNPWVARGLAAAVAVLLLLVIIVLLLLVSTKIPLPSKLPQAQTTQISYADGSPLGTLAGQENRIDIPFAQIPKSMRDAIIAAEDRRYYSNSGISPTGLLRAVYADVTKRRIAGGGSTITQQYAKNAYLGNKRTITRKIREAFIAIKLDQQYSKNQVLEFYLNTIYFGRGAYGVEAASQTYFGIPAAQLNPAQSAVLAQLVQSPERLDPAVDAARAMARWRYVVAGMVKDKALSPADAAALTFPPVRPRGAGNKAGQGQLAGPKGYLVDMVRAELLARGLSPRQIYTEGLKVKTGLDPKSQAAAEMAVSTVLTKPDDPQASLVAIEPGTGRILAVWGGRDYLSRQFNNATQALRQPGSSFKAFVLAAGLAKGVSLKSTFNGASPQMFKGYDKPVSNFNDEQFGNIDLVTATAQSVNTVYVPLAQQIGLAEVAGAAHAAGIPDGDPGNGLQSQIKLPENPSLALGTTEVHPIDMAAAYATFAARGRQATPYLIEEVKSPDGQVIYKSQVKARQAISADPISDLTFALQHVVTDGTGNPEAQLSGGRPAAGKTGTTSDNKDAWFVGYTPHLVASVWMGFDPKTPQDKTTLTNVEGVGAVTGGTLPARVWKKFMDAALSGSPVEQFPPPVMGGQPLTATTSSSSSSSSSTSPSSTSPSSTSSTSTTRPSRTTLTTPPFPEPSTTQAPSPSTTQASSATTTTR